MFKKIKIKSGRHYPLIWIPTPIIVNKHCPTTKTTSFMFTSSCLYDFNDNDQLDINKLFGFSIGLHHNNSFRLGWRPSSNNNSIEILTYEYINGIRQKPKIITTVDLNIWVHVLISYNPNENSILYFVDGNCYKHEVIPIKKNGFGYMLGFYFGGNKKAPQDIIVFKC
jgi:hypothetical protein